MFVGEASRGCFWYVWKLYDFGDMATLLGLLYIKDRCEMSFGCYVGKLLLFSLQLVVELIPQQVLRLIFHGMFRDK